jgi:hypothetical protein
VSRTITPPEVRFERNVDRSGGPDACHPWTGGTQDAGYGVFHPTKRTTVRAHRFALELHLGRPLLGWALHACDNPPCCNVAPGHLYEGDHARNVADAVERGRHKVGERDPGAKLTPDTVREIRRRIADGESTTVVAALFGVAKSNVSMIANGRRWRHVL